MHTCFRHPASLVFLVILSGILGRNWAQDKKHNSAADHTKDEQSASKTGTNVKKPPDTKMEVVVKCPSLGWLNEVCYSLDGKELSRVWAFGNVLSDVATRKKHRVFDVGIRMLAYSPDGKTMATAEGNDGARIWNTTDPGTPRKITPLGTFAQLTKPLHVLLTPEQSRSEQQVYWAAYSPDGSRLLTALSNGHVKIWATASGKELTDLAIGAASISCASFHTGGKRLVAGDEAGVVHLWDIEKSKAIIAKPMKLGRIVHCIFSPDGMRLVTVHKTDFNAGSVLIWNTADWSVVKTHAGYWSAAFSKDGNILALGGNDVRLLATASLQELRKITLSTISLNEASLSSGANDKVMDQKIPVWVQALSWKPDGRELAAACWDGTVRLLRIDQ